MINIAIDGYSACGKSTLAKAIASELDYRFIDTGAMYRAVTLYFIRQGVSLGVADEVAKSLGEIDIDFANVEGRNHTFLNGEDVEDEIRGMAVGQMVSPVAAISAVRRYIVPQQKKMGLKGGVVMDGRDIGTVVFPNAELKIFVTADMDIRVKRRLSELLEQGKQVTEAEVRANLLERDHIDSTRADSPLKQAEDAILLDNSKLSFQEFIDRGIALAKEKLNG
ncbi:cytidylate kinase [Lewinellaceae bacterium SD302]|nr:cytidylate kinase [Lewinellaceae bacterium SD302]